jgi:hypothetical protein
MLLLADTDQPGGHFSATCRVKLDGGRVQLTANTAAPQNKAHVEWRDIYAGT